MAVGQGARVVNRLINGTYRTGGRPGLEFAGGGEQDYDLVAVASGVNSNFIDLLAGLDENYTRPKTTRAYICEFRSTEEEVLRHLGRSVHVFLLSIPRFEFAAIIPKGPFATVVMVGEDLDQELVHEFLSDPARPVPLPGSPSPSWSTPWS